MLNANDNKACIVCWRKPYKPRSYTGFYRWLEKTHRQNEWINRNFSTKHGHFSHSRNGFSFSDEWMHRLCSNNSKYFMTIVMCDMRDISPTIRFQFVFFFQRSTSIPKRWMVAASRRKCGISICRPVVVNRLETPDRYASISLLAIIYPLNPLYGIQWCLFVASVLT